MSTTLPDTPPRKKRQRLWLSLSFILSFVGLYYTQLWWPSPRVVVSKQTTYITEPIGSDGLPDYEQYVLDASREGVTPENNAAMLLWQALGPGTLDASQFEAICNETGVTPDSDRIVLHPVDDNTIRQRITGWLHDNGEPLDHEDVADRILEQARRLPWTSDQIPVLAKWIQEYDEPLDLIVAASRRSRYYSPSPTLLDDKDDLLMSMSLPGCENARIAARALATRAMWSLGNGRRRDAWRDLLALHRLAQLARQGRSLVEQLVAMAINQIAFEGTVALLEDRQMSVDQAKEVHNDLLTLEPFSSIPDTLEHFERLSTLDAVLQMRRYGPNILSPDEEERTFNSPVRWNWNSMDWNFVLQDINRWYDRLGAISRRPPGIAKRVAFAQFDSDLREQGRAISSPIQWLYGRLSRHKRSKLLSTMIASLMIPALDAATTAEDRTNTYLDLERLDAALAVYRAEHDAYPETLDTLVPDLLPQLPVDAYNAKSYQYRHDRDGFLLSTTGENGQDDGGSNSMYDIYEGRWLNNEIDPVSAELRDKIPAGADDISIRVPRPAFEWPKAVAQ